jgi:uncharacterized OB-fold protein
MPAPIDYGKLKIVPDFDTAEWWAGTKQRKYLVRQCKSCGHKWFPPFPACGKCASMSVGWFETSGRGVIYSYVVVVQPIVGAFVQSAPYVVAIIELDDCREPDGTVTRVAGVLTNEESEVAIGLSVQVVFEETNDPNIVMPRWRITGTATNTWKFTE